MMNCCFFCFVEICVFSLCSLLVYGGKSNICVDDARKKSYMEVMMHIIKDSRPFFIPYG